MFYMWVSRLRGIFNLVSLVRELRGNSNLVSLVRNFQPNSFIEASGEQSKAKKTNKNIYVYV